MAEAAPDSTESLELELLLEAVYRAWGYDFRQYSEACVGRRLLQLRRRLGCTSYSQLQDRALRDEAVAAQIVSAVTIQVSEMFRDPSFFLALRERVLPHLQTYPLVRVWCAGCSTGEELYSLAILFREEGLERRTRFYATDIDTAALRQAEAGIYALDRIPDFTRNHQVAGGRTSLSDYYTAAYGNAVFDRTLRERTVFADHSLVSDAAFAEVQLILCRNVLIYFQRPLQDRAVSVFRDALVRRGFLGVGARESLRFSAHASAFAELAGSERIYQKVSGE